MPSEIQFPGGTKRHRLERAVSLLSLLVLLFSLPLYIQTPASPDQMLFDYVAWNLIGGAELYVDVFEINWPGKIWMHELGLRAFGVTPWSFRAIDALHLVGIALGLRLLLLRLDLRLAAALVPGLYAALYVTSGFWFAGQRDVIGGGLLMLALAFATPGTGRDRAGTAELLAAGASMFLAVAMKPTFLAFPVGLVALELLRAPLWRDGRFADGVRAATLITIGLLAPVAVWVAMAAPGQVAGLIEQTIRFNLGAYTPSAPPQDPVDTLVILLTRSWLWLTPLAGLGALLWLARRGPTVELVAIFGVIATTLLGYAVQNKGFMYQLGAMLPAFAVLAAAMPDLAFGPWRRRPVAGLGAVVATGALAVMALGTGAKLVDLRPQATALLGGPPLELRARQIDLAARLEELGLSGLPAVQWGRNYHAVMLAGMPTAWPFVNEPLRADAHLSPGWAAWRGIAVAVVADPPPVAVFDRASAALPEADQQGLRRMLEPLLRGARILHEDAGVVVFGLTGGDASG